MPRCLKRSFRRSPKPGGLACPSGATDLRRTSSRFVNKILWKRFLWPMTDGFLHASLFPMRTTAALVARGIGPLPSGSGPSLVILSGPFGTDRSTRGSVGYSRTGWLDKPCLACRRLFREAERRCARDCIRPLLMDAECVATCTGSERRVEAAGGCPAGSGVQRWEK
jgi:hypothetical protein